MAERARDDLKPNILEPLGWEPDKLASSLDTVFTHAIGEAIDAIDWYLRSKRRKKRWALFFRVVAIVAGSIAGILPMLSQVLVDASKQPIIQPVWLQSRWRSPSRWWRWITFLGFPADGCVTPQRSSISVNFFEHFKWIGRCKRSVGKLLYPMRINYK